MPRGLKNIKGVVSAAIFIVLEVAALSMLSRTSGLQNIWAKRLPRRAMTVLWRGGENVRGYFNLRSQNERLAQENFALSEELRLLREGASVREPSRRGGLLYIPATIVKMSRNSQHNYIILDKGSEDGVTPLSGIISDKGAVGIIDVVDKKYSYGLTLLNSHVQISARLGREGVVAPLVWDGLHKDGALLKDIPLHHPVAVGDTVRTSGFSSIFPADIALGTVSGTKVVNGSTLDVRVRLFQDFSTLRFTTVVVNTDRHAVDSLSKRKAL